MQRFSRLQGFSATSGVLDLRKHNAFFFPRRSTNGKRFALDVPCSCSSASARCIGSSTRCLGGSSLANPAGQRRRCRR
eukprot:4709488-Pyramimonas_sp.AAC.1